MPLLLTPAYWDAASGHDAPVTLVGFEATEEAGNALEGPRARGGDSDRNVHAGIDAIFGRVARARFLSSLALLLCAPLFTPPHGDSDIVMFEGRPVLAGASSEGSKFCGRGGW